MTLLFLLAIVLPWIIGNLLVRAIDVPLPRNSAGRMLRAALGWALGLGVTSCSFFLWLVLYGEASPLYFVVEIASVVALAVIARWPRRKQVERDAQTAEQPNSLATRLVAAALVVSCLVAVTGFVYRTL